MIMTIPLTPYSMSVADMLMGVGGTVVVVVVVVTVVVTDVVVIVVVVVVVVGIVVVVVVVVTAVVDSNSAMVGSGGMVNDSVHAVELTVYGVIRPQPVP